LAIGTPAAAATMAVAVLMLKSRTVAAGATGVEEVFARASDGGQRAAEGEGRAGDFFDGFAFLGECCEQ
jgi:hypothetical protein